MCSKHVSGKSTRSYLIVKNYCTVRPVLAHIGLRRALYGAFLLRQSLYSNFRLGRT